jgi:selenium-binding protein 1
MAIGFFWDLRAHPTIDLGANHQMALEVRPAHDPVREYGLGVVVTQQTRA